MSAMASQTTGVLIVYSIVCSSVDQRKHQRSASLAFVRGIHRGPVNSPHKGRVTRKMLPFWWRHHGWFFHGTRIIQLMIFFWCSLCVSNKRISFHIYFCPQQKDVPDEPAFLDDIYICLVKKNFSSISLKKSSFTYIMPLSLSVKISSACFRYCYELEVQVCTQYWMELM